MGKPYPVIKLGTTVAEVSELLNNNNQAVLLDYNDNKYQLITKFDIVKTIN